MTSFQVELKLLLHLCIAAMIQEYLDIILSTDILPVVGDFLITSTCGLNGLEGLVECNKKCRSRVLSNDHFWLWYISSAQHCTVCLRESESIRRYCAEGNNFWYSQCKVFTAHRRLRRQWYSSFSSRVMICKAQQERVYFARRSNGSRSKRTIAIPNSTDPAALIPSDIHNLLDQFMLLEGLSLSRTRISAHVKHLHLNDSGSKTEERWEYYWREFKVLVDGDLFERQPQAVAPASSLASLLDATWKSVVSNFVVPEIEKVVFQPFEKRVLVPSLLLSADFNIESVSKRLNLPQRQVPVVRQIVNRQREIVSFFTDLLQAVGAEWSDVGTAADQSSGWEGVYHPVAPSSAATLRWFCCAVPLRLNPYHAQCLCVVVVRFLPLKDPPTESTNSDTTLNRDVLYVARVAASSFQRYPLNLQPVLHPLDPLFGF